MTYQAFIKATAEVEAVIQQWRLLVCCVLERLSGGGCSEYTPRQQVVDAPTHLGHAHAHAHHRSLQMQQEPEGFFLHRWLTMWSYLTVVD